jgi:excisionase family DNA binding protein
VDAGRTSCCTSNPWCRYQATFPSLPNHEQGTQLLDIDQVAARLRISKSSVYKLMAKYGLPSVKVGGSRRVTVDQLNAFVARLESEAR